jgi:hypothetical protein
MKLDEKFAAARHTQQTKPPCLVPELNCVRVLFAFLVCFFIASHSISFAQQKGQWQPGQFGLNAGVIPAPGISDANMPLSYSASQLNDSHGNAIPGVTGSYSVWVDENIAYYVPTKKILGGYYMPYISVNWASGELVADFTGDNLGAAGGGSSLADTRRASEPGLALWQTS